MSGELPDVNKMANDTKNLLIQQSNSLESSAFASLPQLRLKKIDSHSLNKDLQVGYDTLAGTDISASVQ